MLLSLLSVSLFCTVDTFVYEVKSRDHHALLLQGQDSPGVDRLGNAIPGRTHREISPGELKLPAVLIARWFTPGFRIYNALAASDSCVAVSVESPIRGAR